LPNRNDSLKKQENKREKTAHKKGRKYEISLAFWPIIS
jgi:hypothetical protein